MRALYPSPAGGGTSAALRRGPASRARQRRGGAPAPRRRLPQPGLEAQHPPRVRHAEDAEAEEERAQDVPGAPDELGRPAPDQEPAEDVRQGADQDDPAQEEQEGLRELDQDSHRARILARGPRPAVDESAPRRASVRRTRRGCQRTGAAAGRRARWTATRRRCYDEWVTTIAQEVTPCRDCRLAHRVGT